jgi:hypothetical protein
MALYVFTLDCFVASRLASSNLKGETGKMRRLALAVALACVLSGMVRAGEIPSTGVIAPPPPSTATVTEKISTIDETAPEESSTVLTIILTLIDIVR